MPKPPPLKKISFDRDDRTRNELPKRNKQYYIDLSPEDYLKLEGKEKSKASLIRHNHQRQLEGRAPNPEGKNQYTEERKIREYIKKNQAAALAKLNETLDFTIDGLATIAGNTKETTLNRIRAYEVLLAYQLSKPSTRKEVEEEDGHKTFIIVPADEALPVNIEKTERVRDPEKK